MTLITLQQQDFYFVSCQNCSLAVIGNFHRPRIKDWILKQPHKAHYKSRTRTEMVLQPDTTVTLKTRNHADISD